MATIKTYTVKRARWAKSKVDGQPVHISRENQDQIPHLMYAADIRESVKSHGFEEHDTGLEETTPEDVEAADLLETKAGLSPRSKKKES